MMSFGFGDFVAGVKLCTDIIAACSEISGAPQSHRDFIEVASALKVSLQNLVDVIRARNNKAESDSFRHENDEATWTSLREVTLDFRVTLETIQLRLRQYPVNSNSGLGGKIMYWYHAKEEIQELLDRCRYHITTINFILEPFKIKVMTDIQEKLVEIHGDVKDIKNEVYYLGEGIARIEDNFDDLRDMLLRFDCKPESSSSRERAPALAPRRTPAPAPLDLEITSADVLDHKFRTQMRNDSDDPRIELNDVTLAELTKSAVWWLEKGRVSVDDAFERGPLAPLQYLNLRKAAWIVGGFKDHPVLENSPDKNSLWHSYCQKLKLEVEQVFLIIRRKNLQVPNLDLVNSLEPCYFSPLVELDLEPDNTLESYGEELILKMLLPGVHYQTQPTTFLVFRQGSGQLRCVEVVRSNHSRGRVVKETIKEYIINRSEWNVRPFYMFRPEDNCLNLVLYKTSETKSFTFSNHRDLFAFQHAFLDANVRYVSSYFKKIRYQEPGVMKSARDFSSGLLQIWHEKPRPRLDAEGNTPSTEASLSPTTTTTHSVAWSNAPSIAFSTTTTYKQDSTTTLLSVKPVETSRLFACLMGNGKRQFITFNLGNNIGFSNTSCCSNFHLHPKKGKAKQVPKDRSEICCRKLVIETVVQGGTFPAQILESAEGDNDTLGMALDEKRLPKGSKTIKLSDFTVTFESETEKLRFITEYHTLERIRAKKEASNWGLVSELKMGEKKGEQPPEDLPQMPRRSSTFSGISSRFLGPRRGSNVS